MRHKTMTKFHPLFVETLGKNFTDENLDKWLRLFYFKKIGIYIKWPIN